MIFPCLTVHGKGQEVKSEHVEAGRENAGGRTRNKWITRGFMDIYALHVKTAEAERVLMARRKNKGEMQKWLKFLWLAFPFMRNLIIAGEFCNNSVQESVLLHRSMLPSIALRFLKLP